MSKICVSKASAGEQTTTASSNLSAGTLTASCHDGAIYSSIERSDSVPPVEVKNRDELQSRRRGKNEKCTSPSRRRVFGFLSLFDLCRVPACTFSQLEAEFKTCENFGESENSKESAQEECPHCHRQFSADSPRLPDSMSAVSQRATSTEHLVNLVTSAVLAVLEERDLLNTSSAVSPSLAPAPITETQARPSGSHAAKEQDDAEDGGATSGVPKIELSLFTADSTSDDRAEEELPAAQNPSAKRNLPSVQNQEKAADVIFSELMTFLLSLSFAYFFSR
eukprot:Gregarina_sp_Poly_1__11403@NODE_96_length_14647_cov_152_270302_g83_i0_p6_GENE_NODE_96_length_14647_cov_152_270302_g83_i0NODE_96_length_14647_cov_152_270302_g83_i0_p6_ORF_typecomplete_len279_score54_87zinc_ribbon_15/PF17032_5/0_014zfC2HC_2/PF13913_6/0_08zinc_ribbon_4/PF13717_6/0_25_NODE_96_length_14647_cov_152_270302_g83_i031934029